MYNVAVLVGSLRPTSGNRRFAQALEKLAAGKLHFNFVEIADLPFYDETLWDNPPAPVVRLKQEIAEADAILFVTPEYNRSIPGVLKNAIDWPSRPMGQGVWGGKPAAIVGATPGHTGTAVAQSHLRTIVTVLGVALMGAPEVYFQLTPDSINADGDFTDARRRAALEIWVQKFEAWIARFAEPRQALAAAE